MGSIAKQGIKGSVYIGIGFLIGSVTNFFIFPKICSKEEMGQYLYLFQWAMVIAQFLGLGSAGLPMRYYPAYLSQKRQQVIFFMCAVLPMIGIGVFLLFCLLFGSVFTSPLEGELLIDEWLCIAVLFCFAVAQTYIKVYTGMAMALGRAANNFFISEIYIRIAVLAVFVGYALDWYSFSIAFYLLVLSYFIQALLTMISAQAFKNLDIRAPERKETIEFLSYGSYSLLDSGANILVTRLDGIMISYLLLLGNVQEYNMAINMATVIMLPWRSLVASAVPYVSENFHQNRFDRINEIYRRISNNLMLIGGFIFIGIVVNLDELLLLIPDNYTTIKYSVIFLGIAKMVDMTSSINGQILVISPYYRYNLYFNLVLIGITVLTNFIFIPIYGITGSAIATLIAVSTFNLAKGWFLYRMYKFNPFNKNTLVIFLGLLIIYGCVAYIPLGFSPYLNIGIRSMLVCVLYALFILLVKPSPDLVNVYVKVRDRVPGLKKRKK